MGLPYKNHSSNGLVTEPLWMEVERRYYYSKSYSFANSMMTKSSIVLDIYIMSFFNQYS